MAKYTFQQPMFIRTLINWKNYRKYIKMYETTNPEKFEDLMRRTALYGFNKGVESFDYIERSEQTFTASDNRRELSKYANMSSVTLEQMLEKQREMQRIEERIKSYTYDPNWKPTAQEMLDSAYPVICSTTKFEGCFFKLYYANDKLTHVALIAIPGYRTEVLVKQNYDELKDIAYTIYSAASKECTPVKQNRQKNAEINIDRVKRNMGISTDRINDIPDDIF